MLETVVTIAGHVCNDVVYRVTSSGAGLCTFRLASTPRRFDRASESWVDGPTSFYTVTCWRGLGENVAASVSKGQPVLVTGRLRVRDWSTPEGRSGTNVELDATTVGHDLSRGTSAFKKVVRVAAEPEPTDHATVGTDGPDGVVAGESGGETIGAEPAEPGVALART